VTQSLPRLVRRLTEALTGLERGSVQNCTL